MCACCGNRCRVRRFALLRAVHGAGRTLLVADGAKVVGPHSLCWWVCGRFVRCVVTSVGVEVTGRPLGYIESSRPTLYAERAYLRWHNKKKIVAELKRNGKNDKNEKKKNCADFKHRHASQVVEETKKKKKKPWQIESLRDSNTESGLDKGEGK